MVYGLECGGVPPARKVRARSSVMIVCTGMPRSAARTLPSRPPVRSDHSKQMRAGRGGLGEGRAGEEDSVGMSGIVRGWKTVHVRILSRGGAEER